mmetsp:Transcript_56066/g.63438  ORF Transcript_56066/g.63438 Transcript_56066/m.63438 type:complete len:85 (+) Transcript_56066:866-1120(+)
MFHKPFFLFLKFLSCITLYPFCLMSLRRHSKKRIIATVKTTTTTLRHTVLVSSHSTVVSNNNNNILLLPLDPSHNDEYINNTNT